jgi:circadian clock protein KaiC
MAETTLVRTGIAGVDNLLHGGIPRTNVVLVEGGIGSGKTLFGIEFIYKGITEFNEPGIIVVFETSPAKLVRDAATMGWDLPDLQAQKKLQIVFTNPQVIEQELRSADSLLLEMALEIGAKRIFIDGVGLLHQSSRRCADAVHRSGLVPRVTTATARRAGSRTSDCHAFSRKRNLR